MQRLKIPMFVFDAAIVGLVIVLLTTMSIGAMTPRPPDIVIAAVGDSTLRDAAAAIDASPMQPVAGHTARIDWFADVSAIPPNEDADAYFIEPEAGNNFADDLADARSLSSGRIIVTVPSTSRASWQHVARIGHCAYAVMDLRHPVPVGARVVPIDCAASLRDTVRTWETFLSNVHPR